MTIRQLPNHDATLAFGRELGASARAGEVIALTGTLGAGKTTLTSGIVAGVGASCLVTSPTFSLVHEYRDGRVPVFHLDFYRLESIHELTGIGWDDILDEAGVVIVEWADRFPAAMPDHTLWIDLDAPDEGSRTATIRQGNDGRSE